MSDYLVITPGSSIETLITSAGKFTQPLNSLGDLVLSVISPQGATEIKSKITVQRNDDLEKYIHQDISGSGNTIITYDPIADSLWYDIKTVEKLDEFVIPNNKRGYFRGGVKIGDFVSTDVKIAVRLEISQRDYFDPYSLGEIQQLIDNSIAEALVDENPAYQAKGTWDASLNITSPGGISLVSGVGKKGDWYRVTVAGTTDLDGENDWQVNDYALFDGTVWKKIDNSQKSILAALGSGLVTTADPTAVTIDVDITTAITQVNTDVLPTDRIPEIKNKLQGRQVRPTTFIQGNIATFNTTGDGEDSGYKISQLIPNTYTEVITAATLTKTAFNVGKIILVNYSALSNLNSYLPVLRINDAKYQYGYDFCVDSDPHQIILTGIEYGLQEGDLIEIVFYTAD